MASVWEALDFGETVLVLRPGASTRDELGRRVASDPPPEAVCDVIVAPPDTDVPSQLAAQTVMTLHFPKGHESDSLAGCKVVVRGRTYAVLGEPVAYKASATPGGHDLPVHVGHVAKDGDARAERPGQ